jgi:Family of unknown function (DUF6886)
VRAPAPPYVGEGPHALWHVSENPSIKQFEPHVSATASSPEPRVWAIDTRHVPLYWFPRECPRGTFWATPETTAHDAGLLDGSARVHIVERGWVGPMRTTRVYAYRLPAASFAEDLEVGGYWLSRENVVPEDILELGDLVARHAAAGIELRVVDNLWTMWDRVVASSLEFSGIRLHNAVPADTSGTS